MSVLPCPFFAPIRNSELLLPQPPTTCTGGLLPNPDATFLRRGFCVNSYDAVLRMSKTGVPSINSSLVSCPLTLGSSSGLG
jgi:hypothetical protein